MGYKAVIVEGNPRNYRSQSFVTSTTYGITAHESVGLPAPECRMAKELVPGGLNGIHGQVNYSDYECLRYVPQNGQAKAMLFWLRFRDCVKPSEIV